MSVMFAIKIKRNLGGGAEIKLGVLYVCEPNIYVVLLLALQNLECCRIKLGFLFT